MFAYIRELNVRTVFHIGWFINAGKSNQFVYVLHVSDIIRHHILTIDLLLLYRGLIFWADYYPLSSFRLFIIIIIINYMWFINAMALLSLLKIAVGELFNGINVWFWYMYLVKVKICNEVKSIQKIVPYKLSINIMTMFSNISKHVHILYKKMLLVVKVPSFFVVYISSMSVCTKFFSSKIYKTNEKINPSHENIKHTYRYRYTMQVCIVYVYGISCPRDI